jgi:hypothetical protein
MIPPPAGTVPPSEVPCDHMKRPEVMIHRVARPVPPRRLDYRESARQQKQLSEARNRK